MDDRIDFRVALDEPGHLGEVGDIDPMEFEARARLQSREPCLFQRDIVIGVEIVGADHLLAAIQQVRGDMKPDKPRAAGNQNCHAAVRAASDPRRSRRAAQGVAYRHRPSPRKRARSGFERGS